MAPDFDKCILNLLSSLLKVYGFESEYPPLPAFDVKESQAVDNLILVIVDGLGQKYVDARLPYLKSKSIDTVSTVFPATTASAILTYYTGVAPNQHGCTGWFTYLPEIDGVSTILPFNHRGGQECLIDDGIEIGDIFPTEGYLFDKIEGAEKHLVTPANLRNNPVSELTARDADRHYFSNTNDMLQTLKDLVKNPNRKFIFNYYSEFDAVCHKYGVKSSEAYNCIKALSDKLKALEPELVLSNSRLIICSDHGFLDTTEEKVVFLHKHPLLKQCVKLPLAGDSRVKNCRIKPGMERQFLNYIKGNLADICDVYSREEILEMQFYGPLENNPKFVERIGDFVIIMKGSHVFLDFVPGEDFEHFNAGNHSGMSEDEMLVPVIQLGV